jgi:casein kinase II subunit beta
MYEKYRNASFGRCPRVFCQGQPVLPVGLSDLPRNYTVNVFCARCQGLFFPKSTRQANIDGAYFGSTFPHLYLMTHPVSDRARRSFALRGNVLTFRPQEMIPSKPAQTYVPRVYGFRVNEESLFYRNRENDNKDQVVADTLSRSSRRLKRTTPRK